MDAGRDFIRCLKRRGSTCQQRKRLQRRRGDNRLTVILCLRPASLEWAFFFSGQSASTALELPEQILPSINAGGRVEAHTSEQKGAGKAFAPPLLDKDSILAIVRQWPKLPANGKSPSPSSSPTSMASRPGDQLEWVAAGDAIRVFPANSRRSRASLRRVEERLKLFRQMLERQRQRQLEAHPPKAEAYRERPSKPHEIARGWRREDLYTRGRSY